MLKNLLLLAGFSTFVVIVVIGFNLLHESQISSLPKTTQTRIKEIPEKFDTDALDGLKDRLVIPADITEDTTVISEDSRTPNNPNGLDPEPSISPAQNSSTSAIVDTQEDSL